MCIIGVGGGGRGDRGGGTRWESLIRGGTVLPDPLVIVHY